jgi:hypothetical protein
MWLWLLHIQFTGVASGTLMILCQKKAARMSCVTFGCLCLWILVTSLEDQETASVYDELPEHCQQDSDLSSAMQMEVEQTSAQQEILPQDMG